MLSLAPTPTTTPLAFIHRRLSNPPPPRHRHRKPRPISAASSPQLPPSSPSPGPAQVYQPFRPPPPKKPSPSLDVILETLANRFGLWHEYAPLIPILSRLHSFSPAAIEETTGISGVEQNRLVVAAQVRDSLLSSSLDADVLSHFDISGGAELLYEIRLLSASQRAAAARRIAHLRLNPLAAQELARAMKDFPRRRSDDGWDRFSPTPGDCLAFSYFRQSREHTSAADRAAALQRALDAADTDSARLRIAEEIEGKASADSTGAEDKAAVRVPVVRLRTGEVAEASTVVVLPVVRNEEGGGCIGGAPGWRAEGEFGVVVAERGWGRWVALPGWEPVVALGGGGVVVRFGDGRVLPWKVNRGYAEEEILVVVDRERREVAVDGAFYLVAAKAGESAGLGVVRGDRLKESGGEAKSLGMVVLVVRPPRVEVEDQLTDDDWE